MMQANISSTNRVFVLLAAVSFVLSGSAHGEGMKRALTDQLGRTVCLPHNPERIVSLAPSITEIIYALGQGPRLKGATIYSDYPAPASRLPRIGSYVHPDLERIVALEPDLCIATKDGNPREVIDRLEHLNIPVFAVSTFDISSVMASIELLGGLLHAQREAEKLTGHMSSRIKRVRTRAADIPQRPRVFFQIGASPIVSVGTYTCIHRMIETAGGENIAKGQTPYPRFSREQVLAHAPEVIIITSMGGSPAAVKARQMWLQWKDIPAARSRRVHVVDSDVFDRPGPRMVKGLELLAQMLHPEEFGDEQH